EIQDNKFVLVPSKTSKWKTEVRIHIHSAIRHLIPKVKDNEYLFEIHSLKSPSRQFTAIRDEVGIKSDSKHLLSFHSYRHSTATILAEQGVKEAIIKIICGWDDKKSMVTRYTHYEKADEIKEAIESMPNYIK
ncbi:MAG: tyrosine-type recombinase/integrase, partial [Lentisphaeria bacterium]|nr:tyrosine-type recombinase/integrase [Lentisphaeria bacterium]